MDRGCRTCKTRHVKCDETKPICKRQVFHHVHITTHCLLQFSRCALSGFRCDGYGELQHRESEESLESLESEQHQSVQTDMKDSSTTKRLAEESPVSISNPEKHEAKALIVKPSEPYGGADRSTLKAFVQLTALMVGRSNAGAKFWQVTVPQAAWSYPSVRHAMLAAALSCQSLIQREGDSSVGQKTQTQVLRHASRSVHELLYSNAPLDVTLLTSATLAIMELFNGCWDTACTHVTSGAKLAQQAKATEISDPFISFYCEAFASLLPTFLAKEGQGQIPFEKSAFRRLMGAVKSLRLGLQDLDRTNARLIDYKHIRKGRIQDIMRYAYFENAWILARWQILLNEEMRRKQVCNDQNIIDLQSVESPWSSILLTVNDCIDRCVDLDVTKFEVAMERNLPFYTLAKSGPHLKMREDATQLMYMGAKLRGRGKRALRELPAGWGVSKIDCS